MDSVRPQARLQGNGKKTVTTMGPVFWLETFGDPQTLCIYVRSVRHSITSEVPSEKWLPLERRRQTTRFVMSGRVYVGTYQDLVTNDGDHERTVTE